MQRFYSPITPVKIVHKEESGLLYVFKAILALKEGGSTTPIPSAFNLFFKGLCYLGITEAEKQLLCEGRALIIQTIDNHIVSFMPEFFTDEEKLRIVKAEGKTLEEQALVMKTKTELLYQYPALLSLLFNLEPTKELREKLLQVAYKANILGEKDFAPRLLKYLKSATINEQKF